MLIRTLTIVTPPTWTDLTALATVKAELGITDTSQDAVLSKMITQASGAIFNYTFRPEGFGASVLTETFRLDRSASGLVLSRDIQLVVTSVVEDGVTLTIGTDCLLDGASLRRLINDQYVRWNCNKAVVGYTQGYTSLAAAIAAAPDLERCCMDWVTRVYSAAGRDPNLRSERILDVIERSWWAGPNAPTIAGLPEDLAERLTPFVRHTL